jgi:hypothetical protein
MQVFKAAAASIVTDGKMQRIVPLSQSRKHTYAVGRNCIANHARPYLSGGSMGATTALWYRRTSGVGGDEPGKCRCPSVSVGLESLLLGP